MEMLLSLVQGWGKQAVGLEYTVESAGNYPLKVAITESDS